jgi:hypothetical protein
MLQDVAHLRHPDFAVAIHVRAFVHPRRPRANQPLESDDGISNLQRGNLLD